ncbi:hypothetical protein F5Y11DRAFT_239828 [Daldinia sp. FL1419]|nr:hypothetical protein F5Y11DRAFT_239828 [Daldinia sp. FL1419]
MATYTTVGRASAGSLENEQFYSAPPTRGVSRRVSLITSNNLKQPGHSTTPAESPISIYWPGSSTPVSPLEPQSPRSGRPRPATPFATHRHHNTRRHHFCPKSINRRFNRTFRGTSDSIPLLQPLTNDSNVETNGYTKNLVSSPGSPAATDYWSPVYGALTPHSEVDRSVVNSPISISRQTADTIVRNIQTYLSNRRHNNCSSRTERPTSLHENLPPLSRLWSRQNSFTIDRPKVKNPKTADGYLVTTDDIEGILDIVIAGIRCVCNSSPPVECLSMLLPKESMVKPTPNMSSIIPGPPSIADPATTISSVQASFSMASCSDYHSRYADTTRTTFISRQSITEVT